MRALLLPLAARFFVYTLVVVITLVLLFADLDGYSSIYVVIPLVLFGGSAILTFRMVKPIVSPLQQKVMLGVVVLLAFTAAVFLIPAVNEAVIGLFWFLLKVFLIVYLMIWFRGTFPRFRYDQLMDIGWKVAIPVGMGAVLVNALLGMTRHA